MTLDKVKIERALTKKGFEHKNSDHNYFHYIAKNGKRTKISTKTSFGAKMKVIGEPLLGMMARQCKLDKEQFKDLIECHLSRDEYEKFLKGKGII